jgi:hypothetical protein
MCLLNENVGRNRGGLGAVIFSILSADVRGYDNSSRVLRMMLSEKGKARNLGGT